MVTGDHYGVADMVGAAIGVDAVLAERSPAEKVDAVAEERAEHPGVLVMVGDGINDAPALAADVGVAMGARGATASSEAADIVITVDRLDRLPEAIRIARRSRMIAVQSVVAGMAMSIVAMLVATTGALPPVAGALLQEAIDVIVIINALRALTGGLERVPRIPGWTELGFRLRAEHRELAPSIARIRSLADHLGMMPARAAGEELEQLRSFLIETLVPHEEREDRDVFPLLARAIGNDDVTAALHRTIPRSSTWSGSRTVSSARCRRRVRDRRISPTCGACSMAWMPSCGSTWPRRRSSTWRWATSTPPPRSRCRRARRTRLQAQAFPAASRIAHVRRWVRSASS